MKGVSKWRVHRLYQLEKLQVQRRKRRRGVAVERRPLQVPTAPNQVWSMDFVSDSLEYGQPKQINNTDWLNQFMAPRCQGFVRSTFRPDIDPVS